jgi:hypothetical protein
MLTGEIFGANLTAIPEKEAFYHIQFLIKILPKHNRDP